MGSWFKNVLRTFEAEILKKIKNIQNQPKSYTFLCIKRRVYLSILN